MESDAFLVPEQIRELIKTSSERLFYLEQQKARFGFTAPQHILAEINETVQQLERLRAKLDELEKQEKPTRVVQGMQPATGQVTILLEGSIQSFDSKEHAYLIDTLAQAVGINSAQIRVLRLVPGSIQITLEMPEEAAKRLLEIYLAGDRVLQPLKIKKLELVPYQFDAFISYSHRDADWVRNWLLPRLDARSLRVFIDFRDFQLGAPLLTEIEHGVISSKKTLIVLSPEYLASAWTELENILVQTQDPAAHARRLIPILLKPCKLPLRIGALVYLDFSEPQRGPAQFERLVESILVT